MIYEQTFDQQTILLAIKAMSRSALPIDTTTELEIGDGEEVVGSIPRHLQHLCNFFQELHVEEIAAEQEEFQSRRISMVRALFRNSVAVWNKLDTQQRFSIRSGWRVVLISKH